MAKIRATQKLIVEDFPDQKDWIGKLIEPVNSFITRVLGEVNGNLEFGENVPGVEKEFDFSYVSDSTSFPQVFRWELGKKPGALVVVSALENTPASNRNFIPVIVAVSWNFNAQNEVELSSAVKITSAGVTTLVAGNRYKIKVRVGP